VPRRIPTFRPRFGSFRRTEAAQPRASSHERGYGSAAWQRVRKAVIARDGGCCRECGKVCRRAGDSQIDHVVAKPVSEAAEATPLSGLQLLCRRCHSRKTARESL
jgi:5-methylcytosine-specific restriction endonuclease McrA